MWCTRRSVTHLAHDEMFAYLSDKQVSYSGLWEKHIHVPGKVL